MLKTFRLNLSISVTIAASTLPSNAASEQKHELSNKTTTPYNPEQFQENKA